MFRRTRARSLQVDFNLTREPPSQTNPPTLTILFNGTPVPASPGESAAAALLAAGIQATRQTPVSNTPRGPFCMMGACFDCLATVDGISNTQLCLTPTRNGMTIETQQSPHPHDDEPNP